MLSFSVLNTFTESLVVFRYGIMKERALCKVVHKLYLEHTALINEAIRIYAYLTFHPIRKYYEVKHTSGQVFLRVVKLLWLQVPKLG